MISGARTVRVRVRGARTVCGGGRGQGAGARYRRCAVEGVDKGRERDIGCADGARWRAGTRGGSAISGARTVRGQGAGARYRVRGRCAVEGGHGGRARWRAGTRGGSAISGARTVRGGGRGQLRGGSAISGARTVRGGGRGQGAGARYRVRGRARWRAWTRGGSADGARWRARGQGAGTVRGGGRGLPFCQYSLRLGFRVPGLTLF